MSKTEPHTKDNCPFRAEIEILTSKIDQLVTQSDDIHKVIYRGNGTPALTVRMDRLEQKSEFATKVTSAIGIAVLGILLTAGWNWLSDVNANKQTQKPPTAQSQPASPATPKTP